MTAQPQPLMRSRCSAAASARAAEGGRGGARGPGRRGGEVSDLAVAEAAEALGPRLSTASGSGAGGEKRWGERDREGSCSFW
eukprot:2135397-Pyramimonas_sp.AAC.1